MEAIGRLTGGVAHDFNNLLTVINGYAELLLHRHLDHDDSRRRDIEQIRLVGERAATLNRQLMAFSRQQVLQPTVLDLNETVTQLENMLQRLIGEHIELITVLEPDLKRVKADPGQIEQVIVNLVVNARDAMPQGGKLIINTTNVDLDETYVQQHLNVSVGSYIMLTVSDTGVGMDTETQARIFEPFFTTKESGEGSGLGLATVHGIVKQSNGHVSVYSELGQGTSFKIYLPSIEADTESMGQKQVSLEFEQGTETILLVEDDDGVRLLAERTLTSSGYTVLEAGNSEKAQKIYAAHQETIHLLLTDVVLPGGMSGPELAKALLALSPEMKVLYMSGYADGAIAHYGDLDPNIAFLTKPFTPSDLLRTVRKELTELEEGSGDIQE
jgi:CheY-like chemotaxis protein